MAKNERVTRPEPERDGPIRDGRPTGGSGPANPAAGGVKADEVVAHAIRLAYSVIDENIKQTRAAAGRMEQGNYGIGNVSNDLGDLASRLVHLGRDLSTAAFDVMEAVLRDPALRNLTARPPLAPQQEFGGNSQAASTGPAWSSLLQPGALFRRPAAPAGEGQAPWTTAEHTIPLTCEVTPPRRGYGEPALLRHPDNPAMPVVAGLQSPDRNLPPLQSIRFGLSADGNGAVAMIDIPDGHPAGTYSGTICDSRTHKVLGVLTVTVLQP
jgi:hypothetical protein